MSIANEIQRLQSAKADIKSAIEQKGVTVGNGTIDTYAEKIGEIQGGGSGDYDQGYEDGKSFEYNMFWDNYQEKGNRTNYSNAFAGLGWNNNIFKPKYTVTGAYFNNAFATSGIEDLVTLFTEKGISLDFSKMLYPANCFIGSSVKHIGIIDLLSCENTLNNFFATNTLEVIDKIISYDYTRYHTTTFNDCTALTKIIFEGIIATSISFANSSLLSDASVQSIIGCLKDLTGGTAQTLTLHATVGGKLTDEQKATITAKNWTLVY